MRYSTLSDVEQMLTTIGFEASVAREAAHSVGVDDAFNSGHGDLFIEETELVRVVAEEAEYGARSAKPPLREYARR